MPERIIRPLNSTDLPAYRAVRLAGLARHPEAFGSSWEEERAYDDPTLLSRMLPAPPGLALGGFAAGTLVAIGGLVVMPRPKIRHIGTIYGVYVDPAHRRGGLARGLLAALLDAARGAGLLVVHLTVSVGNEGARRLYVDLGFKPYGVSRRALRIGDRFADEELMALDLDALPEGAGSSMIAR